MNNKTKEGKRERESERTMKRKRLVRQQAKIIIIVKLWNKSLSNDFYLANQKYELNERLDLNVYDLIEW